jgi:hypothetical protein
MLLGDLLIGCKTGTISKFTTRLQKISASIRLAKETLKAAKADKSKEFNRGFVQIENVVNTIKILLKHKINSELFSRQRAYFLVGPLDQDSSDLILEKLRERLADDLEKLIKLSKCENFVDEDNLHDLSNEYRNTVMLVLNSVREFNLVNKESFTRVLNTPDTLLMIARSDLRTVLNDEIKTNSLELESLQRLWRRCLDELIQG